MTTTENNKLLAEFMNWEYTIVNNTTLQTTLISDLDFSKDWNWVMKVVEKIESISGVQIFINGITCEIMFKGRVISKHNNSKIEALYNACVEFVKWYNKEQINQYIQDSIDIDEWSD